MILNSGPGLEGKEALSYGHWQLCGREVQVCAHKISLQPLDLQLLCRLFLSPETRQLGLVELALCLEFRGPRTNPSQLVIHSAPVSSAEKGSWLCHLLGLNGIKWNFRKKVFAQYLARNRQWINVSWIQIYTEKYLLPARLDNCWMDTCP